LRVTLAVGLACLLATGAYPVEQKKKSGKKTGAKPAATSTAAKPAASRTKRGSTNKSATRKTGAAKTASSKTASTSKTSSKKTASTKKGKSARSSAQTWRSRQAAPTPDRYKQIQEALAAKGYLNGEPSGVWNGQSTEALRRFQSDQNLEPSGKLNSLSLIALGLGPKRDNAPVPPPPPR
jgi:hypothetical protein